ncbi:MAG TPA: N-6 DNA methylase [Longimicrobiaceae bacterium]|nr:N-6 DNA methylase [Longimicrobiaceae bacterium]
MISLCLSEQELLGYAAALGAADVPGISAFEKQLLLRASAVPARAASTIREQIRAGEDPLGEAFSALRTPEVRRPVGATYTPLPIVQAMVGWARQQPEPEQVVDPGVGSARFLLEAGKRFPRALLIGSEIDPTAALVARANLAAAGLAGRARVELVDYRELNLPRTAGRTLYVGNPPYVRHHLLSPVWKAWLAENAALLGLAASKLAGLHVYFFLKTALIARPGDTGVFITAAEWLDVNYGQLVRELFLERLGGRSLLLIDPAAQPFPDAATTAVITTFRVGDKPPSVSLRRADDLGCLAPVGFGAPVRRERLATEHRWTHLLRGPKQLPEGYVQLGELCRVHRGQVTGANRVWIAGPNSVGLPESVLFPTVTRARELFDSNGILSNADRLKRVIDLPVDLNELSMEERGPVDLFLRWARTVGADQGYIARHRRAWWAVGLRRPPPILATYMARRPPAFVRNAAGARHINIAHGIYPRDEMGSETIKRLAAYLVSASRDAIGRTYAGGLMKFEPREMERIPVPGPDLLLAGVST